MLGPEKPVYASRTTVPSATKTVVSFATAQLRRTIRNGPAKTFQNPDNVVATKDYLYIQEDPNGYGDETHDSYLRQYNLVANKLETVFELDHRRSEAKYNVGGTSKLGSWENSGIIDISDVVKKPGTFLVGIQAHTWTGDRYKGADGSVLRANENQASQLIILSGLPR